MIQKLPILSRPKLTLFLECQRRFQLRSISQMRWPSAPIPPKLAHSFELGKQFHRILEQHFLGFLESLPPDMDTQIMAWWAAFQESPPLLPDGKRYPEVSFTVPVGEQFLMGRYDLLILNETGAYIFDWKTERKPRTAQALKDDLQTRLYCAMVVEGSHALGYTYTPEQVSITYWFASTPEKSVTLKYDSEQHRTNWADLKATVQRMERRMVAPDAVWPLTEDFRRCERCDYSAFCGRDVVTKSADPLTLEMLSEEQGNLIFSAPSI